MTSNGRRPLVVEDQGAQGVLFAAGGGTASTIAPTPRRRTAAGQQLARNPFGLTLAAACGEVRRCLARGWQTWEVRARFLSDDRRGAS